MIPEIDCIIGLLNYSTEFRGCGGRIKQSLQDFEVTEVLNSRTESSICNDGDYPVYHLNKSGIDTRNAISAIYKRTGIRLRSLGNKDARAITTQYVYSNAKSRGTESLKGSRYSLKLLGYMKKPMSKKHMIGNRFSIKVSGNTVPFDSFDEYCKILNYYGYQRFGSARPVTHLVGQALIQGRYSDAVRYIVSHVFKYDTDENTRIRQELADPSRFKQTYDQIPPQMDLERRIVSEMIKHGNALKALRTLPVEMRRFYVQAYQSYIFNLTLSHAFDYGEQLFASQDGDVCYDANGVLGKHDDYIDQSLAIPTVGYSYYKKTRFHFYISKILEQEEIHPKDFYLKDMQEASNEGGFRNASIQINDFVTKDNCASFLLSRGSFATIVMREIIKPSDPLLSGF